MLTADCNAPPQLLAGEFARSLTPYADCVEKYGGSRMTKGTVRDVYLKHLEHNPSAAPKFHAWVDPTAPSRSPPLSEPAPSITPVIIPVIRGGQATQEAEDV